MYQNKYPIMNTSIGMYSINKPEAGCVWGGYIHIYICVYGYYDIDVDIHVDG